MTVAAKITTTMKKDQLLANQKNKQQFIFMLSTELEKSNCKTDHAPGDADLLIVQKAVQSATISKTMLVGEDTDLIVLLCYHVSLDSHNFFINPEPKKNPKSSVSGTSEPKILVKTSPTTSSLYMLFLGVTQTSCLYGIGRGASLSKFKASSMFCE